MNGYKVAFLGDEKILIMSRGDDCVTLLTC